MRSNADICVRSELSRSARKFPIVSRCLSGVKLKLIRAVAAAAFRIVYLSGRRSSFLRCDGSSGGGGGGGASGSGGNLHVLCVGSERAEIDITASQPASQPASHLAS